MFYFSESKILLSLKSTEKY